MRKQLNALKAMYFSYYALNAVLLPFLPLYFQQKGYTSMQIGLLMMMGPFVAVFAQPVWGYISDRLRTVKAIIAILWGLTIAVSVGLFLAGSFMEAFAFSLLLYFFMMPSAPLIDSMTIQTAIREGRSYGSVRLWGSTASW